MKKLSLALMAIALTAGVASAFANNPHGDRKGKFVNLFYTNGSTNWTGTRTGAANFYGCTVSISDICARAYSDALHKNRVAAQDIFEIVP